MVYKVVYKVGDKNVYVLGWISVIWWCYGVIYVLYLLCYVKGIYELREDYWGCDIYGRDKCECVLYGGVWVYKGDLIWSGGGVVGVKGVIILDWDLIGECDFIVCVEMK